MTRTIQSELWKVIVSDSRYGDRFYVNYLSDEPIVYPTAEFGVGVVFQTGACLRVVLRGVVLRVRVSRDIFMVPDENFPEGDSKYACVSASIPISEKTYRSLQLATMLTQAARDMAIRYRLVVGRRPCVSIKGAPKEYKRWFKPGYLSGVKS